MQNKTFLCYFCKVVGIVMIVVGIISIMSVFVSLLLMLATIIRGFGLIQWVLLCTGILSTTGGFVTYYAGKYIWIEELGKSEYDWLSI